MKSIEPMESRKQRVDMHQFFFERIEKALKNEGYIEAVWLIYACFENRYFRTIEKMKDQCKYSTKKCRKSKNELALTTKIRCLQRLKAEQCKCVSEAFNDEVFSQTIQWVKERNQLMHDLLQLEEYQNMDTEFKELAEKGLVLLKQTYACCTQFRKLFFEENYKFVFPEDAMEKCPCKPKKE